MMDIKKGKYLIGLMMLTIVFHSCLKEIDFEGDSHATIISGVLTNNENIRSIIVTQSLGIKTEDQRVEASGIVFKNGVPEAEFIQQEAGILSLPNSFRIEAGETYHIEVRTKDNQVYQSQPQKVDKRRYTDSISFEIVRKKVENDPEGGIQQSDKIEFYAHIELPDESDTVYYKWQIDRSWNFVSDSGICYKTQSVLEHPIVLLNSTGRPQGPFKVKLSSLDLDEKFWYKHYFNAYLHTIDKSCYEFYEKVQKLTSNVGNLYDAIPAPFEGNVFLSEGEEEIVLGNIEFSLADTIRFPIDSFLMNSRINLFRLCEENKGSYCNLPCYYPCARPCQCVDCNFVANGEYYEEKPDYFVD